MKLNDEAGAPYPATADKACACPRDGTHCAKASLLLADLTAAAESEAAETFPSGAGPFVFLNDKKKKRKQIGGNDRAKPTANALHSPDEKRTRNHDRTGDASRSS